MDTLGRFTSVAPVATRREFLFSSSNGVNLIWEVGMLLLFSLPRLRANLLIFLFYFPFLTAGATKSLHSQAKIQFGQVDEKDSDQDPALSMPGVITIYMIIPLCPSPWQPKMAISWIYISHNCSWSSPGPSPWGTFSYSQAGGRWGTLWRHSGWRWWWWRRKSRQ